MRRRHPKNLPAKYFRNEFISCLEMIIYIPWYIRVPGTFLETRSEKDLTAFKTSYKYDKGFYKQKLKSIKFI